MLITPRRPGVQSPARGWSSPSASPSASLSSFPHSRRPLTNRGASFIISRGTSRTGASFRLPSRLQYPWKVSWSENPRAPIPLLRRPHGSRRRRTCWTFNTTAGRSQQSCTTQIGTSLTSHILGTITKGASPICEEHQARDANAFDSRQRLALVNALVLATMLNRTLLVPMVTFGDPVGWYHGSRLQHELDKAERSSLQACRAIQDHDERRAKVRCCAITCVFGLLTMLHSVRDLLELCARELVVAHRREGGVERAPSHHEGVHLSKMVPNDSQHHRVPDQDI